MKTIVCFGELLLRLSAPGKETLLNKPFFEVHVGGAEANVAVSLVHLGHASRMVGTIADNALGEAALGELRRHGVDVAAVHKQPGRMGLYFLTTGAIHRPSQVLYDRADSAFARAGGGTHDWAHRLTGADWLHVSGITPALGQAAARGTLTAMRAARAAGVNVCFDGNFRPQLWQAWQGDAPALLSEIMAEADLMLASHRDIEVVLGQRFEQADPAERFAAAAQAAFDRFPHLQKMAATQRTQRTVDHHALSAIACRRDGQCWTTPQYEVPGIVDRIGTGDAFAAGVLHGHLSGLDDADGLHFALAAACLKHSLPGDFSPMTAADVRNFLEQESFDVRR